MTVIKRRVDLPVIPVICEMLRPHHASGNTVFLGELYAYLGGKHGEEICLRVSYLAVTFPVVKY